MGNHVNVGHTKFPKQGMHLGLRVRVTFGYDVGRAIGGKVVRDDSEEPWRTIIQLDDGRYVMATECQYGIDEHQVRRSIEKAQAR